MTLRSLPASFWRGGTSNALVFQIDDLPVQRDDWGPILLAAMGSPDPNGRQLDGMGGGVSSLSKVCVIGPATRADADVDFTFGQVPVGPGPVDYGGNCGNMSAAIGPAAIDLGHVAAPADGPARVRIHNTNTGKIIVSHFTVRDGAAETEGDLAIDGVAGRAAPIRLEFLSPGGAKTGRLLPTGRAVDTLDTPGGRVPASLVDAANPCVFVAAATLGKTGAEHPDTLAADAAFMQRMEEIRRAGAVRMGLAPDIEAAGQMPSIPKVAIVSAPCDAMTLAGSTISGASVSVMVRMLSMELPHRAVPITGAICLALAARIAGTVVADACASGSGALTLSHPSGTILVDADVCAQGDTWEATSASVFRTARKLFSGAVHYRL